MKGLNSLLGSMLILLAVVAGSFTAIAQNAPAPNSPGNIQPSNSGKIAFVGIQQVIANCDEGKAESANFRQWAEKRQAELHGLQKEIDALKNQLDVQGSKLTEEARTDLVDLIDAKESSFQRSQQDSQKEADKRQQRATDTMYRKVMPIIEKLAKERDLDSVFFVDQNRDAYIKPSLLLTDDVIKIYNAAYPLDGGEK